MLEAFLVCALLSRVSATPAANFAINFQIPPLAAVGESYSFEFAPTTFTSSDASSLSYALQNAPSWLQLEGGARLLSGTPTQQDIGSLTFDLEAKDDGGSITMPVSLLVVQNINVTPPSSITSQLQNFGVLSTSNSLSLYTSDSFNMPFERNTFSGGPGISYVATSSDRSPLPSWVNFDSTTITFSGVTPPLIAIPQMFGIALIASTTAGFADACVYFNLVVNNHQLAFEPQSSDLPFVGGSVDLTNLFNNAIRLDGQSAAPTDLKAINVQAPSWLEYSSDTHRLTGTAPVGITTQTITIVAHDSYGDTAEALVHVHFATSLFNGHLGTIDAVIGEPVTFQISRSLFPRAGTSVSASLGNAGSWLKLSARRRRLVGRVPSTLSPTRLAATLTATLGSTTQTQEFTIRVTNAPTLSSTTKASTSASPSGLATYQPMPTKLSQYLSDQHHSNAGKIAGIVIAVIIIIAIILGLLWLNWRRRRSTNDPEARKMKIVVHRPPEDGQDVNTNGHTIATNVSSNMTQRDGSPLQLPAINAGLSHRGSKHLSGESVLEPSEVTALRNMNATVDGTLGLQRQHDSYGPSDLAREGADRQLSIGRRARLSLLSRKSDRIPSDHAIIGLGLGHGRPSYQVSGSPFNRNSRSSTYLNRLSMLSREAGPGRSQQLNGFPPYVRRRSRCSAAAKQSIREVDPTEDGDYSKRYDNYIRKRASNRKMDYSSRFASRQSSLIRPSSRLQSMLSGSRRESRSSIYPRSSSLRSPDRRDSGNDFRFPDTHNSAAAGFNASTSNERESQSSSLRAAPAHTNAAPPVSGLSLGRSDHSTEWSDIDDFSTVDEEEAEEDESLRQEEEDGHDMDRDLIIAAKRRGKLSQSIRERNFTSLAEKARIPQAPQTVSGRREGESTRGYDSGRSMRFI